ncbi:unnamed protein product, partial [marine sediment metagenome]
ALCLNAGISFFSGYQFSYEIPIGYNRQYFPTEVVDSEDYLWDQDELDTLEHEGKEYYINYDDRTRTIVTGITLFALCGGLYLLHQSIIKQLRKDQSQVTI